ncbi:tetratricopeptide repeat protein [Treponema primitia]|uniref:tetratricopeptide repeat protein n=1 Tax=Treponema primitia TaxID=88058 RepID=UPI00397EB742
MDDTRKTNQTETASDGSSNRKPDELPRKYFELKEWDKLYAFLLDFETFDALYKKNKDELGEYWRALQNENKEKYSPAKYLDLDNNGTDRETIARYYTIGFFVSTALADYVLTLEFYLKALAIAEKVFGLEHIATALFYNNIGLVYGAMGDNETALEYFQKNLAVCEKVRGFEHPDTAEAYDNIGMIYSGIGNNETALEFFQKDLAICEKVLGKDHPNTVQVSQRIADLRKLMGTT